MTYSKRYMTTAHRRRATHCPDTSTGQITGGDGESNTGGSSLF